MAGAIFCVTAMALAHRHHHHGWWHRPDSDPIQDVDFDVQTTNGVTEVIVIEGHRVTSRDSYPLDDNSGTATVAGGQITVSALTLTGASATVDLTEFLATLKANYFNSKFWADGTATVVIDSGAPVTVPVRIHGSIRQQDGEYILSAEIRGVLKVKVEIPEEEVVADSSRRRGITSPSPSPS